MKIEFFQIEDDVIWQAFVIGISGMTLLGNTSSKEAALAMVANALLSNNPSGALGGLVQRKDPEQVFVRKES